MRSVPEEAPLYVTVSASYRLKRPTIEMCNSLRVDIFEILSVERREDSYNSLITYALMNSQAACDEVVRHALPNAPSLAWDVKCRSKNTEGKVPDVTITGESNGEKWGVFIENKIDATEAIGQTRGYFDVIRSYVIEKDRAGGIFLTLDGATAHRHVQETGETRVMSLTHRELAAILHKHLDDLGEPLQAGSTLRNAVASYVDRASVPPPVLDLKCTLSSLRDSLRVKSRHAMHPGLVQYAALAKLLASKVGVPEQNACSVLAQNQGSATPGLQLRADKWRGKNIDGNFWDLANLDIHLEVLFGESKPGSIHLHFETCPYLTKRELANLTNFDQFRAAQGEFRAIVHAAALKLPLWRMKNTYLQVASADSSLTNSSTIEEFIRAFADRFSEISPVVDVARKQLAKSYRGPLFRGASER